MNYRLLLKVLILCLILSHAMADQCPETKVINRTDEWTDTDQKSLEFAKGRCSFYYPDSPCLKVFEKTETQVYRATCGAARPDQKTLTQ